MTASQLDPFLRAPIAREHFALTVRAPHALVYDVACNFDMRSIWSVRTIFQMRERIMGSSVGVRVPRGIIEELRGLGWGCLLERPGELFVGGAVCQPWLADVKFRAVPPEHFAGFAEPNMVKIAWTLEASPLGPSLTVGIYSIRWLLLPAIRRKAEGLAPAI